jgi:hypothetical protein
MGIYDRDYMLEKKPEKLSASAAPRQRPAPDRAPLWARIKFRIWLWIKGRG